MSKFRELISHVVLWLRIYKYIYFFVMYFYNYSFFFHWSKGNYPYKYQLWLYNWPLDSEFDNRLYAWYQFFYILLSRQLKFLILIRVWNEIILNNLRFLRWFFFHQFLQMFLLINTWDIFTFIIHRFININIYFIIVMIRLGLNNQLWNIFLISVSPGTEKMLGYNFLNLLCIIAAFIFFDEFWAPIPNTCFSFSFYSSI